MKASKREAGGKGMTRALVRVGARESRAPVIDRKSPRYTDPTLCASCGALYTKRTWRARSDATRHLLRRAAWATCPACLHVARGVAFGRVVLRGLVGSLDEGEVRRRIANVARRARFTQPERRVVELRAMGEDLLVRTTSQKLAHRVAHEIEKAFGGRAVYHWKGEDGALDAIWSRAGASGPAVPLPA